MRILFVTSNRIGDAVLNSGVLAALAERYPQARFTIAAGVVSAPLFKAFPNLDRLIVIRKKRSRGLHWFHLWRDTVGCWWDIVVDLRRSGIGWMVPRTRLYRVPKDRAMTHRVALAGSTLGRREDPPAPVLWTSAEDDASAARLLDTGAPVIMIGPTANWQGKVWPAERFAELVRRLTAPGGPAHGAKIAVTAAPTERPQAQPVLDSVPPETLIDLVGLSLNETAACLKRCRAYVGNDSGIMHMAAAAGIPTLGLFGPSRSELYAPWGENAHSLRTVESYDDFINAPGYDRHTTGSLMGSITVDQVYDKMAAMLEPPQA